MLFVHTLLFKIVVSEIEVKHNHEVITRCRYLFWVYNLTLMKLPNHWQNETIDKDQGHLKRTIVHDVIR